MRLSLGAFASLLCLQCTITCDRYSQNKCTFDNLFDFFIIIFFKFNFISTFIFVLFLIPGGRKLLGHWVKLRGNDENKD